MIGFYVQVEAFGVHPNTDNPAILAVLLLGGLREAISRLLGGSVGAHGDEELVPACDMLGSGLPMRTVPGFILSFRSGSTISSRATPSENTAAASSISA